VENEKSLVGEEWVSWRRRSEVHVE